TKSRGPDAVRPGDVLVLICRGPAGAGMEEIYQITSALKYLSFGKHVAVITDARFSGVSTGACVGHVGPEALAGGPIGKVRDGDRIRIVVDRNRLEGSVDLVGEGETVFGPEEGTRVLASRPPRPDLAPDPDLPDDTRLWAALQRVGGGTWGGCVYGVAAIVAALGRLTPTPCPWRLPGRFLQPLRLLEPLAQDGQQLVRQVLLGLAHRAGHGPFRHADPLPKVLDEQLQELAVEVLAPQL